MANHCAARLATLTLMDVQLEAPPQDRQDQIPAQASARPVMPRRLDELVRTAEIAAYTGSRAVGRARTARILTAASAEEQPARLTRSESRAAATTASLPMKQQSLIDVYNSGFPRTQNTLAECCARVHFSTLLSP